jgi:hypothetical protein
VAISTSAAEASSDWRIVWEECASWMGGESSSKDWQVIGVRVPRNFFNQFADQQLAK